MKFWGLPQRFIFQNPQTRRTAQQTSRADLEVEPGTPSSAPSEERRREPERTEEQASEEHGRERTREALRSTQERGEVALDTRQAQTTERSRERAEELARSRRYNPETIQALRRLDIQKPPEEQRDSWNTFRMTLLVSVAAIIHETKKSGRQEISFPSPSSFTPENFRRYLTQEESLASSRVKEMMNNRNAPLSRALEREWPNIVTSAGSVEPVISTLEELERRGTITPPPGQNESGITRFVREHPKLVKWGARIGVAAGVFFLAKWIFGRRSEPLPEGQNTSHQPQERGGFFKGLLKFLGITAGVTAGVGAATLLGSAVYGWIKGKKLNTLFSFGSPDYESLAEKMNLESDVIERLGRHKFKTFIDFQPRIHAPQGVRGAISAVRHPGRTAAVTAARNALSRYERTEFGRVMIPVVGKEVPGTGLSVLEVQGIQEYLRQMTQHESVRQQLLRHRVNVSHNDTSLADVFAVLNEMAKNSTLPEFRPEEIEQEATAHGAQTPRTGLRGALAAAGISLGARPTENNETTGKNPENPENNPNEDVAVETPEGELIAALSGTWKDLKLMARYNAPHVRQVLERWEQKEQGLGEMLLNTPQFLLEFLQAAARENLIGVVIESGRIVVTDGAQYIVLTQMQTLCETAREIVKLLMPGQDSKIEDVVNVYLRQSVPFIVIGGVVGGIRNGAYGILRGSAKGLFLPIYATYKEWRFGRRVVETARGGRWAFRKLLYGQEVYRRIAYERMTYAARRWFATDSIIQGADARTAPQRALRWIRRHFSLADLEADRGRFGHQFARYYNEFYGLDKGLPYSAVPAIPKGEVRTALNWERAPDRHEIFRRAIGEIEKTYAKAGRPMTFEDALRVHGLPPDSPARIRQLSAAWEKVKGVMGPLGAAFVVLDIEYSQDKKKTLVELGLAHIAFLAGSGITARNLRGILQRPRVAPFVIALGGLAAAFGITRPGLHIEQLLNEYILVFPGAHGAAGEAGEFIQGLESRYLTRVGVVGARKGVERLGFQGLERVLQRQIGNQFLRNVQRLAQKQGVKQILKMLGWRGAAMGFMLADDATIIGILDDIIAVGFAAWMAKDIYDLIQVTRQAMIVDRKMKQRVDARIETVDVVWPPEAKRQWQEQSPALLASTAEEGDEALLRFFRNMPKVKIKIRRRGMDEVEVWSMRRGTVTRLSLVANNGEEIATVRNQDAGQVESHVFPESPEEKKQRQRRDREARAQAERARRRPRRTPNETPANREV